MTKMRPLVLASLALTLTACGGGSGSAPQGPTHPDLDQDYTAPFVGTYHGSAVFARAGEVRTDEHADQTIARAGANRLAIRELCPGVDGVVGLDTPTTFSLDPFTCSAPSDSCTAMSHTYRSGTGQLDPERRTVGFTFEGRADGCGLSYAFTRTFAGGAFTLAPPVAVASPESAVTDPGVPVGFDATGSSDPDGAALSFSWTVESQPPGATPALSAAQTATPTFSSSVPGSYRLQLVVTAQDGQFVSTLVPVLVRPAFPGESYVYLSSDEGDPLGAGKGYFYTQADATIAVSASGAHLGVAVTGDQRWTGDFAAGNGVSQLEIGSYGGLGRYSPDDSAPGGLAWSGQQRTCATLTGWFAIDDVAYSGGTVTAIDLRFEQHCNGVGPALRGRIRWRADDTTRPPGPVRPVPADLWSPPPGSTPASGSYAYLESDPGDLVGWGWNYGYTQQDALFSLTVNGGLLAVDLRGDQSWVGEFQAMSGVDLLEPGYYGDLTRYQLGNPARGSMMWSGNGGDCPFDLTGWFAVDAVTYSGTTLTGIDLRFEQHCGGDTPALRGAIHWDAADPTRLGPVIPPPETLWRAPSGSTPASGSYVYLQSDWNDFIGLGRTYSYTRANSVLALSTRPYELGGVGLWVDVGGDERWLGEFVTMLGLSRIEPGFYPNLLRFAFCNGVRGGFSWMGEGRGCDSIGWVVVDVATYSGTELTGLDLRFEQHCADALGQFLGEALHGQIHWDASDPTLPPGPVSPAPVGLWDAPIGWTPPTGTYVLVETEQAGRVPAIERWVYTQADAGLAFVATGGGVDVTVRGDERWDGEFRAMSPLMELQPGYYGELKSWPFNPARGGVNWTGAGARVCDNLANWFVVDAVTYDAGALTSLDLRFEMPCDVAMATRGRLHWDASDPTQPPGPVFPGPDDLWRPPSGWTPPAGSYVYLESDPGEWIEQGATKTLTVTDVPWYVSATGADIHFMITEANALVGNGQFIGMSSIARLEPGYYGDLKDALGYNPARGGLSWQGARHCSTEASGWFVVDGATYSGSALTGLDLRFEQHCWGQTPALHGQIHWSAGP